MCVASCVLSIDYSSMSGNYKSLLACIATLLSCVLVIDGKYPKIETLQEGSKEIEGAGSASH